MKIVILQAGQQDQVLQEVLTSINQVLDELQVNIKHIYLNHLPYYEGHASEEIEEILNHIDQSVGVIIVSRVELLSISGSLCTFFEYCSTRIGDEVFQKPLFAITSTSWRGEREAAEYILHVWDILGGIEFGKLGLYTPAYDLERVHILRNVERMIEDFYRMMKQERVPLKSSDYMAFSGQIQVGQPSQTRQESQVAPSFDSELHKESKRYAVSSQEQDIEDLATLFKQQLNHIEEPSDDRLAQQAIPTPSVPEPILTATSHMLTSLPHYFQGQFDKDFKAIIQYHLMADKPFSGYIIIENGDCLFDEGLYEGAEVELTAQEDVIQDILTKKITYQKAFMLGQLKVRGNFMLLSKIDTMFKGM